MALSGAKEIISFMITLGESINGDPNLHTRPVITVIIRLGNHVDVRLTAHRGSSVMAAPSPSKLCFKVQHNTSTPSCHCIQPASQTSSPHPNLPSALFLSDSSAPMTDLKSIVPELQNALERKQLDAANNLLSQAKRALLTQNALIPTSSTPPQLVAVARQVLELGALASIRQTDAQSFTRYYQQLQPFYDLERHSGLPGQDSANLDFSTSQRSKITGLYLLLLLSMGDSANFHTVLEGLVEEASLKGGRVEDDAYIKYPVELERNLMEGSYDKVWRETKSERVPSEDFGLFSNVSRTRIHDISLTSSRINR